MTLLEPDVALTDFALAIECTIFFVALAIAALLGGITHGFLSDPASRAQRLAWTATLLAVGAASCASWTIGARLILSRRTASAVTLFAVALYAAYAATVVFVTQAYGVAITHYLPAAVFLIAAFAIAYRRQRAPHLAAGMVGVGLTVAAAALQQAGIDLHPVYFNHNALYHAVQAVALALLFWSARGRPSSGREDV